MPQVLQIIALIVTSFLGIRLIISLINLISGVWNPYRDLFSALPENTNPGSPLLSVLIPARNEAENLNILLGQLKEQDFTDMEIMVYDDLSDDDTAEVVNRHALTDKRIHLLIGSQLPKGWLGKNHACDQLAKKAGGSYFLFLDADVRIEPGFLRSVLNFANRKKLHLFSLFPRQLMHSPGEQISVPMMNWVLVSLLPLLLTRHSSRPSLSAANGQCMLFRADTYRKHEFHSLARNQKAEDIYIFRLMKKLSLPSMTMLGRNMISCRMYSGLRDSLQGFSKNVFAYFGDSATATLAYTLVTSLGVIPVWLAWGFTAALLYLFAAWLIRLTVAAASGQSVSRTALLAPLQQLGFLLVVVYAFRQRQKGSHTWKGRSLVTALALLLLASNASGTSPVIERYRNQIYESYVLNDMPRWESTLRQMEAALRRSPDNELLYDVLLAQYGLIGYYLGTDKNSQGRELLERAERNRERLAEIPGHEAGALLFESAFLAFRISLRPLRAVQLGPRSYRLIEEAEALDARSPRLWIEKGNSAFFTPSVFGGSKTQAVEYYLRAVELLEQNMPLNYRWLYLSTLVSLANAYDQTGQLPKAIEVLEKALQFEPRFTWVKDEMLPAFKSRR